MQSQSFVSKYGRILLAMVIFFALNTSVLVYNILQSDQLQEYTQSVKLADRQGLLSQKITRVLYQIADAQSHGLGIQPMQNELKTASELFDSTLYAFSSGGTTRDENNNLLTINKLPNDNAQSTLSKTRSIWDGLQKNLRPVILAPANVDPDTLNKAVQSAAQNNQTLTATMTDLSSEIEQEASTLTEQMRWVQAGALVLVFVIFLYILWEFYGQVGQSDEESEKAAQSLKDSNQELEKASQELAKAKQETDLILSTVRQGLMLVGRDLKIGSQYSKECAEIFRMESLAGHSFLGLMQRLLNEKLYNTTRDFLDLLFDSARKEKPILKVNPLDVVEVNFSNPLGGFITKYLGFNFRRILESGVVARVFVGVTDITQQVKLERELRETEVKKEKQMNFLLEILHANPPQVTDFIETARADLQQMTDTLRSEDFASAETGKLEDLHQRINKVFRSVHNIKGNASLLQLRHFEKLAQEFEAKLHELRSRPSLTSDDFLSVVIHQSKLREDLQELDEIHQKLGELGGPGLKLGAPRSSPSPPVETEDRLVSSIRGLASTLALKMGKVVKVESAGFDSSVFSDSDQVILRDVLIQLTRNSLAHSLETPQERQQSGKAREGLISIQPSFHPESGFQGFVFTDDGRGLDIKKIREQAVEHGMIESEHAESYDENSLAPLIFTPGFSTASSATTEAGQGMGMDIIKTKIVDERGGEITVDVDPGRRCAFGIFLPDQS